MGEDAQSTLLQALATRGPARLSLADLPAPDVLALLAKDGASFHVRITSLASLIELEIGNGLVMGARAQCEGEVLEGRAAYVLLRKAKNGTVDVEPKRFLSMANILEPIGALPDLTKPTTAPPPPIEADTIELPAIPPTPPLREQIALAVEVPKPRPHGITSAALSAFGVVVAILGITAGALGAWHEEAPHATAAPIVAGATLPETPIAIEEEVAIDEEAITEDAVNDDPRELARDARRYLRNGRHRAALLKARDAARLRRGAPYYQVLLGDALEANGRSAEARRAWRRAVRLRANYEPALERLARES